MDESTLNTLNCILGLVVVFGVGLFVLFFYLAIRWFFAIRTGKQLINIPEDEVLAEAPVTWLFRHLVGWVHFYPSKGQVALIGKNIHKKFGLFADVSPFPIPKKIISTRSISRTAKITTQSKDKLIFTASLTAHCRIKPSTVDGLLAKEQIPMEFLQKELENGLMNFVQENSSEILEDKALARNLLTKMYQKKIPYFFIKVSSLSLDGKLLDGQDELARWKDTFRIRILEMQPQLLEETAKKLADKYLVMQQSKALQNGDDFVPDLQGLAQYVQAMVAGIENNSGREYPSFRSIENQHQVIKELPDDGGFRGNLMEALSCSSFRFLPGETADSIYKVEYKKYVVLLEPKQQEGIVYVQIYAPDGSKNRPTEWKNSLSELFEKLQPYIDGLATGKR